MIKFKAGKVNYKCPTSWSDITFKQWKGINKTKDELELISILTGIPGDVISRISENSILKLSLAISFIMNPLKIENYEPPSEFNYKQNKKIPFIKDIKEKTYGQKIYFQHSLLENQGNESRLIEESVLIYSQPYIDKKDFDLDRLIELKNCFDNVLFVDLYSIAIAYSKQLKDIIDFEAKELKTEPTNEQKSAGVDMFSKFGVMNTVKALANNDILNYEKVLKIEYNTVFIHLLMKKTEGIYQENYSKILQQKHKRK
tara:strand:+ start:572 stop:1342 length:771 start_codon:yes stop_codon:yes gene_type:complete